MLLVRTILNISLARHGRQTEDFFGKISSVKFYRRRQALIHVAQSQAHNFCAPIGLALSVESQKSLQPAVQNTHDALHTQLPITDDNRLGWHVANLSNITLI